MADNLPPPPAGYTVVDTSKLPPPPSGYSLIDPNKSAPEQPGLLQRFGETVASGLAAAGPYFEMISKPGSVGVNAGLAAAANYAQHGDKIRAALAASPVGQVTEDIYEKNVPGLVGTALGTAALGGLMKGAQDPAAALKTVATVTKFVRHPVASTVGTVAKEIARSWAEGQREGAGTKAAPAAPTPEPSEAYYATQPGGRNAPEPTSEEYYAAQQAPPEPAAPDPEAAAQAEEAALRDQLTTSLTTGKVKSWDNLPDGPNKAAIAKAAADDVARRSAAAAPPEPTAAVPQLPPAAPQAPYVPSMPEGTTLQDLLRRDLAAKRAAAQAAAPPETPAAAPETAPGAPETRPQPRTVEELSNALNEALAEEPAKPKTVEEYKAQARARRAAATPQWADYLQSKGITAGDVAKWNHREQWRIRAQAGDAPEGLSVPTGKGAAAILEELRKREAAAKAQAPSKIPPVRPYPPPEGFFSPAAIQKLIDIQERQARERAAQQFGR